MPIGDDDADANADVDADADATAAAANELTGQPAKFAGPLAHGVLNPEMTLNCVIVNLLMLSFPGSLGPEI